MQVNKLTDKQETEVMAIGNGQSFTNRELAAHYQVPVSEIRRVRNPKARDLAMEIAAMIEESRL